MHSTTLWQGLSLPPWRFLFGRWPWLSLLYLVASVGIWIVMLPLVATLLLVPLWAIALGAVERRRTRLLGFPQQVSGHVRLPEDERHNWLSVRMGEPATWRETGAFIVNLITGTLVVILLAVEATLLIALVLLGIPSTGGGQNVVTFGNRTVDVAPEHVWILAVIGVLLFGVFAYLNGLLAASQASLLRQLYAPRQAELARSVERLTKSRVALVTAFEAERRRIERDLHDGVQQQLVTLAARLGMASLELDDLTQRGADTAMAHQALSAAQDQAEYAMSTLRNTVRGIHPAVLTDHGLGPALDELAGRAATTIELDVAPLCRMPAAVETAGYYLVSEAITNATKHTTATRVQVSAQIEGAWLHLTVTDNGHGGANEEAGSGLVGLRERAETLGGRLLVSSPKGGPTSLHMALPLPLPERS